MADLSSHNRHPLFSSHLDPLSRGRTTVAGKGQCSERLNLDPGISSTAEPTAVTRQPGPDNLRAYIIAAKIAGSDLPVV